MKTNGLPNAPLEAPESLRVGLELAAAAWFDDPLRPRVSQDIIDRWSVLLEEWCATPDLPIFVRKYRDNRGHVVAHKSGRELVPSDNSPASWSLSLAFADSCPTVSDLREMLSANQIPVAMALRAKEKSNAKYTCPRSSIRGPNAAGWKVAHIDDVGLGFSGDPSQVPIEDLFSHFKKFLSPGNMFLVPKKYAGVAETPEFIATFRRLVQPA